MLKGSIPPGREQDHSVRAAHALSEHFKSNACEPPTD